MWKPECVLTSLPMWDKTKKKGKNIGMYDRVEIPFCIHL